MDGIVDVTVYQARRVKPCGIARKLDGRRRRRQAVVEDRGRGAGNGLGAETNSLLVEGVAVGVAVLLDAVRHGLEPSRIVRVALLASRGHCVHPSHVHSLHTVHAIIVTKGGAAEREGREGIMTGLAAQIREQRDAKANNSMLVRRGIVNEAGE